jgi:hypothetical protein
VFYCKFHHCWLPLFHCLNYNTFKSICQYFF